MAARVPYLDGLRALAILMVVTFHTVYYNPWFATHGRGFWPSLVAQNQGVYLFFILSGFCLAYPTLARLQQAGKLKFDVARFTARRIVRIIPSYYIAIAVLAVALVVMLRLHVQPGAAMTPHLRPVKIVEQALLFNQRPEWLNGSFWTLPIEVHWYFVCPMLIWVWTRSRRAFAVIAVLCWVASTATRLDAPDVRVLPAFMMGIAAADMRLRGSSLNRYAPAAFLVMLAIVLTPKMQASSMRYIPWEVAMFLFVVATGEVRALGRIFAARLFAPIAAASYSIYLIHAPLLSTIENYLPASIPLASGMLFAALFALAAGLLFSLIAEKPFRRGPMRDALLSRLDRWLPTAFRRAGIEPFIALTAPPERPMPQVVPPAPVEAAPQLSGA